MMQAMSRQWPVSSRLLPLVPDGVRIQRRIDARASERGRVPREHPGARARERRLPPRHLPGRVQVTRADAEADVEDDELGRRVEAGGSIGKS